MGESTLFIQKISNINLRTRISWFWVFLKGTVSWSECLCTCHYMIPNWNELDFIKNWELYTNIPKQNCCVSVYLSLMRGEANCLKIALTFPFTPWDIASASHQGLGSRWTLPLLYIENFQLSSTHLVTSVKFEHTCQPSLSKNVNSASVRKIKGLLVHNVPLLPLNSSNCLLRMQKKSYISRNNSCTVNSDILSFQ